MDTNLLKRMQQADEICNRMYIARNISMNVEEVYECLREIDRLYRSKSEYEQWELDDGGFW